MSCPPLTNKGGKLYISEEPVDENMLPDDILYAANLQVPGVGSIGDTGVVQDVVSYSTSSAWLSSQGKGSATPITWDIEILDAESGAREVLEEASRSVNNCAYATTIQWADGETEVSINLIHSARYIKGSSSGVRVVSYSMTPVSIPARVPQTLLSNEDVIVVV